ncbi:MAG: hypothetical protein Q9217_003004 [Psora testacea]
MHEILTIQLGHRANHVATHFWNTQESYFTYDPSAPVSPVDHDIHFRPGLNSKGEDTYTPRTLVYDLKGGFGGSRNWGGLYDQQLSLDDRLQEHSEKGVWNGKVSVQQNPQIPQSDYQNSLELDNPRLSSISTETVRYWSDYNRIFYHPRSIIQLNEYGLNSSLLPFEKLETGEELFQNIDREEDVLDRDLRPWAEECDQMQGVQVLAGADDAWAGFAGRYIERLRDEFGKKAVWVWSVGEEQGKGSSAQQTLRAVNAAKGLTEISTHASMYVPISIPAGSLPPYVELDRQSQWHTSALLSAALETMTLPSRLRAYGQQRGLLDDLIAALNTNGSQRVSQLQCSALGPETGRCIAHALEERDNKIRSHTSHPLVKEDGGNSMTADLDIELRGGQGTTLNIGRYISSNHVFGSVECVRENIQAQDDERLVDEDKVAYTETKIRLTRIPVIARYRTTLAYPVLDSFPNIFANASNNKIGFRTLLSTSTRMSRSIKSLQETAGRMASLEEREALVNSLGEIAEAYEEGWDCGSGDDSED